MTAIKVYKLFYCLCVRVVYVWRLAMCGSYLNQFSKWQSSKYESFESDSNQAVRYLGEHFLCVAGIPVTIISDSHIIPDLSQQKHQTNNKTFNKHWNHLLKKLTHIYFVYNIRRLQTYQPPARWKNIIAKSNKFSTNVWLDVTISVTKQGVSMC